MRAWRLVRKEMMSSLGTTAALVVAVAIAVSAAVAGRTATEALSDNVRRLMLKLGNNLVVLPPGAGVESMADHSNDRPRMGEDVFAKLAKAPASESNVRHLRAELRGTARSGGADVRVLGLSFESDLGVVKETAPRPGEAAPGSELAERMKLAKGSVLDLGGRSFTVASIAAPTGTPDDAAVTTSLADAQDILGAPGRISSVTAVACRCEGKYLTEAEEKVGRLLPGSKVVTFRAVALARAETRRTVERFGTLLAGASVVLGSLVVALALWMNVTSRRAEMGTLLALGMTPRRLAGILAMKVAAVSAAGTVAGCIAGAALGARVASEFGASLAGPSLGTLGTALAAAFIVAAAGALAPLVRTMRLDAAEMMRGSSS